MRCNFETTGTLAAWNTAVIILLIVFGYAAFAFVFRISIVAAVFGILFLLTLSAAIFLSFFHGGVIRARGKQVIISHNFMSGNAFDTYIRYKEIEYAE
ncbi:MAG: hypothetical protein K2N71_11880, partial [Oscillospiraceae bacterium]|nr:hypothetical protein [Oscillospiraceae bacterium]